ncbi:MAG: sugar ABC transporter ATP-binding protein [Clostridiaceae bacterium]|nr:sugar ABC transporter ATP-binding protein [Clostridiaceae bacterium]
MIQSDTFLLEVKDLCKKYNHIVALDNVSLQLRPEEVTAIVGDNGSGKSTLIKILSGSLIPDSGTIILGGNHYQQLKPRTSVNLGIRVVYQDLSLDNYKNSFENIFLGEELRCGPFLAKKRMAMEARRLLDDLQIHIPDLSEDVGNLSGGQRQGLALARALRREAELLILDEPTAAMGVSETESVFRILRELKAEKRSVLIISHNLFQVFDIADRIFILKAGKCIGSVLTRDSSPDEIHNLIKWGV